MNRWLSSLAIALPALLVAHEAGAVRNPDYLAERPLETAHGARGRLVRQVSYDAPATAAAAWSRFTAAHGDWHAIWDTDTRVPLRIWGPGIAVPGASADPAIAEAAARALLAAQLDLIAPGSKVEHWTLVSNQVHGRGGAMRTVGFTQQLDGVPVQGGAVSFLFKHDRLFVIGSQALPSATARVPGRVVSGTAATEKAIAWIASTYGARPTVIAEGGVSILPLIREREDGAPTVEFRTVKTVTLDLAHPRAQWDVFVDAETGLPLARRELLFFGTGVLKYNTPIRYPAGGRSDFIVAFANLTLGANALTTDLIGSFNYTGAGPAVVNVGVVGPRVRVTSNGGAGATSTVTIPDAGSGVWNAGSTPTIDSQLTAFAHVNLIKNFAKAELNPDLAWLDRQLNVDVNIDDTCNANAGDNQLNFFSAGSGCENTGRLPDVVYHEFGHALHFASIIAGAGERDGALSEGSSDYLAATTVDDSGMGRGFFEGSASPLRELDPAGAEHVWPRDIDFDTHETGLIIAGALWDLRKAMITTYGAVEGKRKTDDLYYAILQRAADIPSTYVEVLAADDDDGDLTNGTPNQCLINTTFGDHGLIDTQLGLGIGVPVRDGFTVTVAVSPPPGGCDVAQISSATLDWKPRGGNLQQVALTQAAGNYTAVIPDQPEGTVVEYRVVLRLDNNISISYPENTADPLYQFYVGPLQVVYCTDFESDPFAAGWTHVAQQGTDDWEWGTPTGVADDDNDPPAAFSGTKIVGQDLGLGTNRDGNYARNSSEALVSPVIDVNGKTGVRLQFQRWLSVEDGFYDQARVLADGSAVWTNAAGVDDTASNTHHDREWRFHDIDLTAAAADGSVQIRFDLTSDPGLQFGGWAIDDFCIMAKGTGPLVPVCGNGAVETGETCDDGNAAGGDGCSATCADETDPGDDGGCCSTGTDPRGALVLGLGSALLVLRRRRRRAA